MCRHIVIGKSQFLMTAGIEHVSEIICPCGCIHRITEYTRIYQLNSGCKYEGNQ